jgi:hypothetical protein
VGLAGPVSLPRAVWPHTALLLSGKPRKRPCSLRSPATSMIMPRSRTCFRYIRPGIGQITPALTLMSRLLTSISHSPTSAYVTFRLALGVSFKDTASR